MQLRDSEQGSCQDHWKRNSERFCRASDCSRDTIRSHWIKKYRISSIVNNQRGAIEDHVPSASHQPSGERMWIGQDQSCCLYVLNKQVFICLTIGTWEDSSDRTQ